jgi:hypothetical protein
MSTLALKIGRLLVRSIVIIHCAPTINSKLLWFFKHLFDWLPITYVLTYFAHLIGDQSLKGVNMYFGTLF